MVLGLCGCPGETAIRIECIDDTSCGLAVGGHCLVNPATGNQFCAYPDAEYPDGMRWSDFDVESSISGTCVASGWPDAGMPDAPETGCVERIAFRGARSGDLGMLQRQARRLRAAQPDPEPGAGRRAHLVARRLDEIAFVAIATASSTST